MVSAGFPGCPQAATCPRLGLECGRPGSSLPRVSGIIPFLMAVGGRPGSLLAVSSSKPPSPATWPHQWHFSRSVAAATKPARETAQGWHLG